MKSFIRTVLVTLLTLEARLIVKKYQPKIVAVVGSVGKTATKDAVYTALSTRAFVRKSEKSYNSEIGVPLTILGRPNAWNDPILWIKNLLAGLLLLIGREPYPEWLVLEVGADHPGDIEVLGKWITPDIVVLTRFPTLPVHVEFFDSPEAVNDEDYKIVKALKETGLLVVNADDPDIMRRAETWKGRKLSYGFKPTADVALSALENRLTNSEETSGILFTISHEGAKEHFRIMGALGAPHAYATLAGVAVGVSLHTSLSTLKDAFEAHQTPRGRMKVLNGLKGTIVIDDSYNASPVALEEALTTLKSFPTHRRTIVAFGDMLELGTHSIEAHKEAGKRIAEVADVLVTVGIRTHFTAKAAITPHLKKKNIIECHDSRQAGMIIQDMLEEGDVILVKGSQSIRMERCVEEIMLHPERKADLLVRQEREWEVR